MNINKTYTVNFTGGYRFRNMPLEAKSKLPEISNKWKQVFYDFENIGDVFLVTRDKLDTKVFKFIKENKLNFEYYPQITTKSGLDTEEPQKLSQLINNLNVKPITTLSQLSNSIHKQIASKKVEENALEYSDKILKTLHIDTRNLEQKIANGIVILNDKEFERKIHISRPKKGIHYVLIEPYSPTISSSRYAIDINGNFIESFNTPDKIKEFYKILRKSLIK